MGPAVLWVGMPWLSIFLAEILDCLQGVCACVCVVEWCGGGWGEGGGGGLAGQQSRELVKLPVTLNSPLEAQREFRELDLEPPEGSSEGRDFRGWWSGF